MRNVTDLSTFLSRENFGKKSLKDGLKTVFQVQDTSPDVACSPFDLPQDYKAHNRFTMARKVRLLSKTTLFIGDKVAAKTFGSVIDYKCDEPMLQHDLTQITLVIDSQWQVNMTLETYNSLCSATKTPSALVKVH